MNSNILRRIQVAPNLQAQVLTQSKLVATAVSGRCLQHTALLARMPAMKNTLAENFDLPFPSSSGFSASQLLFYTGECDLKEIYFGEERHGGRLFVTDANVARVCSPFVSLFTQDQALDEAALPAVFRREGDALCVLPAGEESKTIDNVLAICRAAVDANLSRTCLFVGIGGGVVLDMTGFAASIFKRGVGVEFVSTTLLADVDAAIGGKTGCDFSTYKNMIGSFHPALRIHVWPSFIHSLSEREYLSGLAEAVKTALLFSAPLVDFLRGNKERIFCRDEAAVDHIIRVCAKAKARTVQEDLREKGIRAFLNYGHTFGHALESTAGLGKVAHGEAVAWGISRAVSLSLAKGLCSPSFAQSTLKLLATYGWQTAALPKVLQNTPDAAHLIVEAMHKDKKNSSSKVRVILQEGPQSTLTLEVTDDELLAVLGEG